ncbi:hypothetical protein [Novosphingobium sp. P6W]|uniref:hypothetical protein n=1 Tax=Novosphingobium sp. P6W TaxID=1609758 RepID=UPI0005C30E61|nr:hypothetical protein [Novosphingobium sp. P6W]KIS30798.1 hypothetical protein TQ38_20555 [Novosphingobium sp. P6W]
MRGTRTLSLVCALTVTAPAGAEARSNLAASHKEQGARAVMLLPEQFQWTGGDRAAIDRSKAVKLAVDRGSGGWSLDFLSLRSSGPEDRPCCASGGHFANSQTSMEMWHAVGDSDVLRVSARVGKVSRHALSAVVFPAKSRAAYADVQLAWDRGSRWTVSTGWFRQEGWGGRRMDLDVVRIGNGESAAASGLRAAARLAVDGDRDNARTWLTVEAREGSRALGPGAGMHHASDVGLTLTAMF